MAAEEERGTLLPHPGPVRSAALGVMLVTSTFLVYVPVAGFAQSFGVFVEMFDRDFCRPDSCLDLLGLVSALALSNFRLLCWVQVLLERWVSIPFLFLVGTVLCFLSMLLTSYVHSVYALLATHSLLYGFGSTFMLNAPLSAIDYYYPEGHRFHILASGIVNLGPSVGVVVMNPLSVYLDGTERYSWRDTLKVFAVAIFVVAGLHLAVLLRTFFCQRRAATWEETAEGEVGKTGSQDTGAPWWPRKWVTAGTVTWLLGIFGVSSVIFIPKTMFINYLVGQGMSVTESAVLLSFSGVSETIMSLIISFTGDLLGRHLLLVYTGGAAVLATSNGLLPYLSGRYALGAYCIVHGACDGLLMTVLFGVVTLVAPPGSSHAVLWSVTNLFVGIGQIAGLPAAGMLYDVTGSYDVIFICAAVIFALSGCMFGLTYAYICLRHRTGDQPEGPKGPEGQEGPEGPERLEGPGTTQKPPLEDNKIK